MTQASEYCSPILGDDFEFFIQRNRKKLNLRDGKVCLIYKRRIRMRRARDEDDDEPGTVTLSFVGSPSQFRKKVDSSNFRIHQVEWVTPSRKRQVAAISKLSDKSKAVHGAKHELERYEWAKSLLGKRLSLRYAQLLKLPNDDRAVLESEIYEIEGLNNSLHKLSPNEIECVIKEQAGKLQREK